MNASEVLFAVTPTNVLRVRTLTIAVVAVTLASGWPAPIAAQTATTREAQVEAEQAKKAEALTPVTPSKAERISTRVERVLMGPPRGVFPWFGSVLGGGGLALGAAYAQRYAETGHVNATAGWSIKNYKLLEASTDLPSFGDGLFRVHAEGRWIDAPVVSFYGIGNDSRHADRSRFLYRPTTVGATGTFTPVRWLQAGGGADYLKVETGRGAHGPSIEERFTQAAVPGLGVDTEYLVTRAFAAIDWRQSPGYSTSGGLYRVSFSRYDERNDRPYSFRETELEVVQLVPLMRANWVIALRGLVTMIDTDAGDDVPFYLMPYLGSGETLRGFRNRRFRDRNRLLLNAEYRWLPSRFLDMAIFVDAGSVAPRRQDLSLSDLHTSYGIGARFHGPTSTALRIELAKSRDGMNLIMRSGLAF